MSNEKTHKGWVAIVGLAGRFPKAGNTDEFWRNVCAGAEGISFFHEENDPSAASAEKNNFVPARGILEGADLFDAAFFGIKPKEAETMDPQHRVFLECAWAALENASCDPKRFDGAIGVFAGMSMNTYLFNNLASHPEIIALVGDYQTMLGNDKDFLPTRVSYKLGLTGPSLNIQTACSTSLVAVCTACQHLLAFQCDMALAGAVSIRFPQRQGYWHQQGGIASPDGHCRPFDAKAAGTVPGEGAAIVVLKRYEDAIENADQIYAVIKGFAINNDGSNKIGYTAPSVDGQAGVIVQAQAMAEFDADSFGYVEAHGTGTPLGDPIEIEALTRAFRESTSRDRFCAIGSVKSNIGHLDTAAGVAGLIKAALALHHKKLPPSLHFESPNPEIDFATSPFYVNSKLREWEAGETPRRAGVSSFGIGGTNAHVVLEEAMPAAPSAKSANAQVLVLSAKSSGALNRISLRLAEHLKLNPDLNLADVAYTLQVGRQELLHRRMLVCRDPQEAAAILGAQDVKQGSQRIAGENAPPVVFMFPGQGAQRPNMGRELYETRTSFRDTVDFCCDILTPVLGFDLRTVLYPEEAEREEAMLKITETAVAQPALFVIEFALARLWMSWGITPDAMIGHSIGEYVAACLSGAFSLNDALKLVAARGRLMQQQPKGSMLAVRLPEAELKPLLKPSVSVAAANTSFDCVASGPREDIDALWKELEAQGIAARPVTTSHAFHSSMMEPALGSFKQLFESVRCRAPQVPFISNVTGTWITESEARDPEYWARHLRQTVRFADGLGKLFEDRERVFLEIGPGSTLSNFARQHSSKGPETMIAASLPREKEKPETDCLLNALGNLWLAGLQIDWSSFHAEERLQRVPLPTYPFERTRYWIEPKVVNGTSCSAVAARTASISNLEEQPEEIIALLPRDQNASAREANGTLGALRELVAKLSGLEPRGIANTTTFTEMGFESLFLTQLSLAVEKRFGVRVAFRQLLEEANCPLFLASYLESRLGLGSEKTFMPEAAVAVSQSNINLGARTGQVDFSCGDNGGSEPLAERNLLKACGTETRDGEPDKIIKTFPLTEAQREIWFASQMSDAASCASNECRVLDLRGRLERQALSAALQQLVDRHESLRTTLSATGDTQQTHCRRQLPVAFDTITAVTERDIASQLDGIQLAEAQRPFDLVNGPLIRAQLFQVSKEHHVLILTVHHIVCDGHSFALLLRELATIYSSLLQNESSSPPSSIQFSDYAQHQSLAPRSDAADEEFWTKIFADDAPVLKLPTDQPRPVRWAFDGACAAHSLERELVSKLKSLSAESDCTIFTMLLASWALLLCRLTGQSEVVVGVPVANRPQMGGDSVVGHCTHFLPIRIAIRTEDNFSAHLANVRKLFLDAYEHQQFTFGQLLQKLATPRDAERMPLVSATLNVERDIGMPEMPGLTASIATNPHAFTNFDLSLNATETNGAVRLECRYNKALFAPETIQRWLGHFQTLLESIATQAEESIGKQPLITPAELHQITVEWNDTNTRYRLESCMHALIEEQVQRSPQAVAVIFENKSLTYRELNQRADEAAAQLRWLGVREGMCVGIFAERSLEMLAGLLGILKAGGAYLPLDPSYPKERLAFMLRDSRAPVVLTQSSLVKELQPFAGGAKTLCLDSMPVLPVTETAPSNASAANPAYVLYTSGSTGTPKGVVVTHRNVANFFSAMDQLLGIEPGTWLANTSISFDISVLELFWTLSRGFTVVIQRDERPNEDNSKNPPRSISENILHHGVTHFQCTPSQAEVLMQFSEWPTAAASLKTLLLGGETLPAALAEKLLPIVPRLFNMYGPTETTVWSAAHEARAAKGNIPIGRPIANTQIYILDHWLQPVPIGVVGELYIGGDGVSRGYLNHADLTAEKFIHHPSLSSAQGKLYRTGDQARFLPDGSIEFRGRENGQVKIRGHRVELGEIESNLRRHPGVQNCVVIHRDEGGVAQLAAYIVAPPKQLEPKPNALRRFLETKIPAYMIPSSFTYLDHLPLLPNGKLNHSALPAPEAGRSAAGSDFEPPVTDAEQALAQIWCDVLKLKEVGVHDNFFELGGHSLLMTQVIARIRSRLGVEITFRRFFESPTIAGLAPVIEEQLAKEIEGMSEEEAQRLISIVR